MGVTIAKSNRRAAFTMVELMIVVLIISVLAVVAGPILRGRIDSAKWTEANTAAGMIRGSVKIYYSRTGQVITGSLADEATRNALILSAEDLTGTYFVPSDYNIDSVDSNGVATVTVTGSLDGAPSGSKTLHPNGDWR